jgi:N-formylglutamate deformylase
MRGMLSQNLLLHIPHSSRLIPPEERTQLAPDDRTLALELLRMTDAFTDELFAPTPFEAARVVFPVSRLVCDVEQFPDDADEPMALRGMGAVYAKTADGRPLREHLSAAERARLIEMWYGPHHQKLTAAVEHLIANGESCIIVDSHSFSSRPLPHEPDQDPARPDICIGTDDWHTPTRLRDALVAAASAAGFSVLVDRPFAGALVPATYYRREPRVRAVMIEVNRQLYMDEETGEQLPSFGEIRRAVSEMLAVAARYPQE